MKAFKTQNEHYRIAPGSKRAGDEIALYSGLQIPMALPQNGDSHSLVALAQVEGIMKKKLGID